VDIVKKDEKIPAADGHFPSLVYNSI